MRSSLILVMAVAMLEACRPAPPPPPRPRPTPTVSALYPRPACTGMMSDAHKRICANESLDWLDRSLQRRWAAEREGVSAEQIAVLDAIQNKFLSERARCTDDACIAAVYRTYLPHATPTPTPVAKTRPRPAPRAVRAGPPGSCLAELGRARATRLGRRCDAVAGENTPACSPRRSCAALRRQIRAGCAETFRRPAYCPQ